MNGINGVSAGVSALTDAYLPNRKGAVQDNQAVIGFGEDIVDISDEARDALAKSTEIKRSEFIMKDRGLNDEEIAEFRDINDRYEKSGKTAKDFLLSLDKKERSLVKRANGYDGYFTDEDIKSFSAEGAVNFLQEQGAAFDIDLNSDGRNEHGKHHGIHMLPDGTPDSVKDAWDIATKDMPFVDKALITLQLTPLDSSWDTDDPTAVGFNGVKTECPDTAEGWINLFGEIYENAKENAQTNPHEQSRENAKRAMVNLKKIMATIDEVDNL